MEDIIQFRIYNESFNTLENKQCIKELYSEIIDKAVELEFWDLSIKKFIITDDFKNEIIKQSTEWGTEASLSSEKEYSVISKILYNQRPENPQKYIFFDFKIFLSNAINHWDIVFGQILTITSYNILPVEIRNLKLDYFPIPLIDYIKFASAEWCTAISRRNYLKTIITKSNPKINSNSILIAFKRKLKHLLFEYQSDKIFDEQQRLNVFWNDYFGSIKNLFLRLVENDNNVDNFRIKPNESSIDLIYNVVFEIEELTQSYLEQKEYDINPLKEAVKLFSAHFDIVLEDVSDSRFRIEMTKNPKDYFIDEIIETEPRIVCFMDILGFSELINDYENDITSTILQDIQESFSLAKKQMLENSLLHNKDIIKHLKYESFSDNICISIPYFDNENDFLTNFNLLSVYIRGFQLLMMIKGIFLRGGVSTGSYYADNNMIFSKGLVNAYHLESKKAIYPRVIIDNSIINKLLSYNESRVRYNGLHKIIIFDWENIAFINPFGIAESSVNQLESVFNSLEFENDDPLINLMHSITKSVGDMSIGLLRTLSQKENEELKPIKEKIIENIIIHQQNENIASKYLWLFEFIKWFEKDESGKLKFQFFADRINPSSTPSPA